MVQKKLQKDSQFNKFDMDGDGVVTDEELDMERRMLELEDLRSDMENDDKRQDAQRNMAWFALFGMLLYPASIIVTDICGLQTASQVLSDIAPTYFVSVAAIVAAFYGKEAFVKVSNGNGKHASARTKDPRK